MNTKFRTRTFWILASALCIAIAAAATIAVLRWQAEDARKNQLTLSLLRIEVHHSEYLAWRVVTETTVTATDSEELSGGRREIARLLAQLPKSGPGIDRQRLTELIWQHNTAIDEEFALMAAGRVADAVGQRKAETTRAFEVLDEAVTEAGRTTSALAERSIRTADLGSALVAILAIVLLAELLRQFDKTRRSMERAEAERAAIEISEERFRSLVQNSSDVTMVLRPNGRIEYVSPSAVHVLGLPSADLAERLVFELAHPEDAEQIAAWLAECSDAPGDTQLTEFRFRDDGAGWRYVEAVGKYQLEEAPVEGIVANVRNITERKRSEAELAAQHAELRARNAELTALQEVSEVASHSTSMDELLKQVLVKIAEIGMLGRCRVGGVLMVEGERLRLASYVGSPSSEFLRAHENLHIGECLCGVVAQTGKILISTNCNNDGRHTIRYSGMPSHGHVIVPLRVMDRVVGVIYFYLPADTEIDERMQHTLLAIGEQVGTAIENMRLYERTKELSLHDPLTGLANRRLMQIALQENFARARRLGRQFSIIMMDLDFFKNYNDRYGHGAGDMLLAEIAKLVLREVREIDLVVRFGGEEFVVILPEAKVSDAVEVAERIRNRVVAADFFHAEDLPPSHITISLGVASYGEGVSNEEELIAMADQAMYAAKRFGRNRVEVYPA